MKKVLILGAGSISSDKPDDVCSKNSKNVLTHANAVSRHKETELIGIVDIDLDKAIKAGKKWKVKAYKDLIQVGYADIIICAVNTERHLYSLLEILNQTYKPKLVIAEKPFCNNIFEAKIVYDEYKRLGVPLALDYIRRYAEGIIELKNNIRDGIYGEIRHVKLTYTRGVFHEACHFIDLCRCLFGEFKGGQILEKEEFIQDNPPEITCSVYLKFEKCNHVFMCPADGRDYCVFEIEIITEKGKILLVENGTFLDFYDLEKSKYGDYQSLSKDKKYRIETGLYGALYKLIDNCVNFLDNKETLICTAKDGLETHKIYHKLLGCNCGISN